MPGPTEVDLEIEGMTCASCVARVEKRLNGIPGVEATVNLATERARVRTPDGVTIPQLVAAVESAGYRAAPVEHPTHHAHSEPERAVAGAREHEHGAVPERTAVRDLRARLLVSAALAIPVVVLSMVPALQFPNWQWLALALAAPVAVWGAWPFHRVAAIGLRHGSVNMDTLVSLGVLAAFGWSLYALFFGDAGRTGMRMTVALFGRPGHASGEIYLEVACGVTVLILLGRWIEARAKRDAGDALRAFRWDKVSMVFQGAMNSLNPVISVRDQLGDVLRTHRPGMSRAERASRSAELLELVGVDPLRLDSYAHELSGGMRQRVMIAMALALDPQVMIMDEPTTALDVVVQRGILREIMRLREQFGFAVVFITHDLPLLLEISDRIAVMLQGEIVELNTAADIYERPQHDYTRRLLSSFPSLTGDRGAFIRTGETGGVA